MANMNILENNKRHAQALAKKLHAAKKDDNGILGGIWHWINGVASGIGHFIGGPVTAAFKALWAAIHDLVDAYKEMIEAIGRLEFWWERYLYNQIIQPIRTEFRRIHAEQRRDFRYLIGLVYATGQYVLVLATRRIRTESRVRARADKWYFAKTRKEIRALHHTIEHEAESGYRIEHEARLNIIMRLLDFAVLRDPLLKDIVGTITTGLLDILSVDNPVARLLLGFLIKKVVDRLGVDKAVGTLVQDLAKPLLGNPKPRDLHDVIADLSSRMSAGERQWAHFFHDGGSQVEQAGREWRDVTGVLGSAATVGFVADAIIAPHAWAEAVNSIIGQPANELADKAAKLFRGV